MNPETQFRLAVFFIMLLMMMSWEAFAPRRSTQKRALRWPANLGIVALNAVMLFLIPVSAVGAALFSVFNHFGLFIYLKLPLWPSIILSLLLLDLAIYWQHRLFHAIPRAWPIHRMHHTDTEFDVTTALRFHPLEILISIVIKAAVIILLGVPVLAAVAFEIILNATAMFNHANIKLPAFADKVLRLILVTPDMHRVHHALHDAEYNSNYGFNLSVWDRLFGSYTAQPRDGHREMQIGQRRYRDPLEARLDKLLTQPFR
ncbi:MAG: sterol desaturase family protein [Gammaproteobacteria bacterium]|nr:sterol desaturase family protein [Gammaproteobacteria bacterium]